MDKPPVPVQRGKRQAKEENMEAFMEDEPVRKVPYSSRIGLKRFSITI
jgi:hypothetical protein